MIKKVLTWILFASIVHYITSNAQDFEIYPVQGSKSLLIGGVIASNEGVFVALTKNTSEQVIVNISEQGTSISSRMIFPHKFFVLNTFSQDNLQLTIGEVYPKINLKEVSFISLLQKGAVKNYKLFTVENGFSEVFDVTLVDSNTLAIAGMGEIKVLTTYSLLPASTMLPQGLLIFASPDLNFKNAYYITFSEPSRYIWRLYKIESLPNGEIIVAGESYSEWDKEKNIPLNTSPFVARVSNNGLIKWAITITTSGYVNDLLLHDDGSIWLIYSDATLTGTYLTNISLQDGKVYSTLFIKGFTPNNSITMENKFVCAGKLNMGNELKAGIVIIDPNSMRVSKHIIAHLDSRIPKALNISPMDVKVFKEDNKIGVVGSLLGSVTDKSFFLIRNLNLKTITSLQTTQLAQKVNVEIKRENNLSLEKVKINEIKGIKANMDNSTIRIK